MKYYIVAGEASGDLHASNLIKAIKNNDPEAQFRAWGGDLMQAAGATIVKHYRDLAFMGFVEVLQNLPTIMANFKICKADLKAYLPDVLILVDYPGFNLRLLKFAKALGIKIVYYISPQLWAWKAGRVELIKKYVDKMMVILPFEKAFYDEKQFAEAYYVGHPLLDAIQGLPETDAAAFRSTHGLSQKPIIALLPGSRKQEVSKMLSTILALAPEYPDYQFVIAGAPGLSPSFFEQFNQNNVAFVSQQTYPLLQCSHAAIVASGTATLETALFNVPQVVCYKGSAISVAIAKRLVKNIKYISLVNLIMDKPVVTELIQEQFTLANLKTELNKILHKKERLHMLDEYANLHKILGNKGASKKAAEVVQSVLI
jgi:lipid-A-disaccharide synthase